mmetsp:Transcript_16030/g.22965  ORF Transcript_16030/g.22965 Transcript_16030/m.22965 type:complete len:82 (-) Transcript_16030:410-655(-)
MIHAFIHSQKTIPTYAAEKYICQLMSFFLNSNKWLDRNFRFMEGTTKNNTSVCCSMHVTFCETLCCSRPIIVAFSVLPVLS